MYRIGLTLIIFSLLGLGTAAAEFYKYADQNGVVRFTDDLNQVPESQQPQVQKYSEIPTSPPPATQDAPAQADGPETPEALTGKAGAAPLEKEAPLDGDAAPPTDLNKWRQALEKQKQDLDQIHKDLAKETEALEMPDQGANSKVQIRAYNERVVELNRRIEDYEKKRSELNQQVKAYNVLADAKGQAAP